MSEAEALRHLTCSLAYASGYGIGEMRNFKNALAGLSKPGDAKSEPSKKQKSPAVPQTAGQDFGNFFWSKGLHNRQKWRKLNP